MSIDESADRALLARAAGGDGSAFAQMYDRHVRPVYWQAYSVLRDADAAEESTQDAFVTLWRRIDEVRIVDESILPWLLATARYTALNAGRRLATVRDRAAPLADDGAAGTAPSPEDQVLAAEIRRRIADAVAALSPIDQRLYRLCVEGDLTYERAASELGVTHAVVRNRVSRLRGRLRADLSTVRENS